MRIGTNPEKEKARKLIYKKHRIIIPVYIPETNHDYFQDSKIVFQKCLKSLLESIDIDKTAITIINNSCSKEVTAYIRDLLSQNMIDKHIEYAENKGKVYAVLQEARASYEEYVTICDSDILFFPNWQNEVISVFSSFKNIGVVGMTPDAHLAFYCNNSLFATQMLSVKLGNIVSGQDFDLFERGINNKDIFVGKKRNWRQNQFYLESGTKKVVIGAAHCASTYRSILFRNMHFEKPILVFPGGEYKFIDEPIDKLGYFRVSLSTAFGYHMGNSILEIPQFEASGRQTLNEIDIKEKSNYIILPYKVKVLIVSFLKRWFYNRK